MSYKNNYIEFEKLLWEEFEKQVKKGAKFPTLLDVTYPKGINPKGLDIDTDGNSWFFAKELIKNTNYKLKPELNEKDIIIDFNHVQFIDSKGQSHLIEPNVTDLYWLCELLDSAKEL